MEMGVDGIITDYPGELKAKHNPAYGNIEWNGSVREQGDFGGGVRYLNFQAGGGRRVKGQPPNVGARHRADLGFHLPKRRHRFHQ